MKAVKFRLVLVVCIVSMIIVMAESSPFNHNLIDKCWRCDPKWADNRQKIAGCCQGFGHNTVGGKGGKIYVVTNPSDNDVINPAPGTLRHAVLQPQPLWIIFSCHMNIKLQRELLFTSHKTIDGRGFHIHIAGGAGFMLQNIRNVIIFNIHMYDISVARGGMIRSSPHHIGIRGASDGDAICIFGSSDVWIDHCSFAGSFDGLIDIVARSTDITISNNHFVRHDKALLFGASDEKPDENMRITVAYNHFGKDLRNGYQPCVGDSFMSSTTTTQCGSAMRSEVQKVPPLSAREPLQSRTRCRQGGDSQKPS
ncbi:putative pectate lyase [Helianthus annuus]|nr:putative pectate lyase [Helianthus annuus]